jgi:formylglycine-generating enzyme required for sulfatase activity
MGEKDYDKLLAQHPTSIRVGQGFETDRPAIPVRITRPFQIAAHEVTVGQFRKFVDATLYKTDAERDGKGAFVYHPNVKNEVDRFAPEPAASWRDPGFEQQDDHPVTCVSWHDAVAFCEWLSKAEGASYRLPTEAEWEFACRAGTDTIYSCGDDPDTVYGHGNVGDAALERALPGTVLRQRVDRLGPADGDGFVYTAPVGKFKPNALGLYDLHGNVWEWCQDCYQDRYYVALDKELKAAEKVKGPKTIDDPRGPETTPQHKHGDWRSLRGGSWFVSPISCRSAVRSFAEAGEAYSYIGFRVVREAKE